MKKVLTLIAVAIVVTVFASCTKETIRPDRAAKSSDTVTIAPKRNSPNALPSLTVIDPDSTKIYDAGEYITVRWKSFDVPAGWLIFAIITSNDDISETMLPKHMARPNIWAVENTGKAKFQITPDDHTGTNILYYRGHSYGKHFRVVLEALPVDANGQYGNAPIHIEASSKGYFAVWAPPLPAGCSSIYGYSVTTGSPCSAVPQ